MDWASAAVGAAASLGASGVVVALASTRYTAALRARVQARTDAREAQLERAYRDLTDRDVLITELTVRLTRYRRTALAVRTR